MTSKGKEPEADTVAIRDRCESTNSHLPVDVDRVLKTVTVSGQPAPSATSGQMVPKPLTDPEKKNKLANDQWFVKLNALNRKKKGSFTTFFHRNPFTISYHRNNVPDWFTVSEWSEALVFGKTEGLYRTRRFVYTDSATKERNEGVAAYGKTPSGNTALWIFFFLVFMIMISPVFTQPAPPACELGSHDICDRAWTAYASSYESYQSSYGASRWFDIVLDLSNKLCWLFSGAILLLCLWRVSNRLGRDYSDFVLGVPREYNRLLGFCFSEYTRLTVFLLEEYSNAKNFFRTTVSDSILIVCGEYLKLRSVVSTWQSRLTYSFYLFNLLGFAVSAASFFSGFRRTSVFMKPQGYTTKRTRLQADRFFHWLSMVVSFFLLISVAFPETVVKFVKFLDRWLKTLSYFRSNRDKYEEETTTLHEDEELYKRRYPPYVPRKRDDPTTTPASPTDPIMSDDSSKESTHDPTPVVVSKTFVDEDGDVCEHLDLTVKEAIDEYSNRPKDDFSIPNAPTVDGEKIGGGCLSDYDPNPFHVCTTCRGRIGLTGEVGCVCTVLPTLCSTCREPFSDCRCVKLKPQSDYVIRKSKQRPSKKCPCGEMAIYAGKGLHCYKCYFKKAEAGLNEQSYYTTYAGDETLDSPDYPDVPAPDSDVPRVLIRGCFTLSEKFLYKLFNPFTTLNQLLPRMPVNFDYFVDVADRLNCESLRLYAKIEKPVSVPFLLGIDARGFHDDIERLVKANADMVTKGAYTVADVDYFCIYYDGGKNDRADERKKLAIYLHPDKITRIDTPEEKAYYEHVKRVAQLTAYLNDKFSDAIHKDVQPALLIMEPTQLVTNLTLVFASMSSVWVKLGRAKRYGAFAAYIKENSMMLNVMAVVLDFFWQLTVSFLVAKYVRRVFWWLCATLCSYFMDNEAWAGSRGRGRRKKGWRNSAGQENDEADFHPDDYYEGDEEYDDYDPLGAGEYETGYGRDAYKRNKNFSGESQRTSPTKHVLPPDFEFRFQILDQKRRTIPREWLDVVAMRPESLLGGTTRLSVGLYTDNLFPLKKVSGDYFVNGFRIGCHLFTVKHALKDLSFDLVKNHKNNFLISSSKITDWSKDLISIRVPAGKSYHVRSPRMGEYVVLIAFGPQTFGKLYPEVSYGVTDDLGYYTSDSVDGNCGGVVVAMSDGAVLGIHSAGSDIVNYYEAFTPARLNKLNVKTDPIIEKLYDMEAKMNINIKPQSLSCPGRSVHVDPLLDFPPNVEKHGVKPYFNYIGSVDKTVYAVNQRKPCPLFKEYCISTGVTPEFDEFELSVTRSDSVAKAINHFARPSLPVNDALLSRSIRWCLRIMKPHIGGSKTHSTFDLFHLLDMSTSAGYPFSAMRLNKEAVEKNPLHRARVMDDAASTDSTLVMTQAMKEEIRPTPKVDAGDQRGIWGGPMAMSIKGLYLFGDMHEKMHEASSGQWYSFVGSTIFYGAWQRLLTRLSIHPNGWALDAKKWDSSLLKLLLLACAWIRFQLLAPEFQTEYNYSLLIDLYKNIIFTVFITPWGWFFMKKNGNPSGGPLTIHDNTIILLIVLCYCWLRTAPDRLKTLAAFRSHVEAALNGDDNTFTVSDEAAVFFNGETVAAAALELGVTFDTSHWAPRAAKDLDFLSATFHPLPDYDIVVPLYDTRKFLVSLYYTRHKDPVMALTRACALHVIGYWDKPFREQLEGFISWLIKRYHHRVDQPWLAALSGRLDDDAILRLYTGFETVGKATKDKQARQKFNHSFGFYYQSLKTSSTHTQKPVFHDYSSVTMDRTQKKNLKKEVKKEAKQVVKQEAKAVRNEIKTLARSEGARSQQRAVQHTVKSIPKQLKIKANPHLLKYLRALIDPESFYRSQQTIRVPDTFSKATATLTSFREISVTGNYNDDSVATGDAGRFCYVVTPSMASQGWVYSEGQRVFAYGNGNGTALGLGAKMVLGANVATLNNTFRWDPATAMQVYVPGPLKTEKNPPSLSRAKPMLPPIIPSQSSWDFFSDTNASQIAGTQGGLTIDGIATVIYSGGAAESIRPVAQCVWFHPSMSTLSDGGNISIALLPPDSTLGQLMPNNFTSATSNADAIWSGQGPIANWENLANVPGAYQGALKEGAYSYWVPSRISDIDMKSVGDNVCTDFPSIVVSGQSAGFPATVGGTSGSVYTGVLGTLRITTIYEYTTVDQSRSTAKGACVPGAFEFVQCALANAPTSMENATHRSWIDKVIAGAAGLAGGVAGFIAGGPAGAVALGGAAASGMYAALG